MPEDQAPPVVAVVVSADPGPWLEGCLTALTAQDYPHLSLLVVDDASSEPLAARVAAVAPAAYLLRREGRRGFGPSANTVLETVENAAFYLFCHDDVEPAPGAVRRMVEEAFRSNAGIVAPKLLDPKEPGRILQLGLGVDRYGAPVRRIVRGELDQAQHDEVREVFAAPGGCTLVRADLFAALGGFDPEISLFGEDVDLCWRARLAGARVVVAPAAEVLHLEAMASRRRPCPEARALQWRHELRAVLKNYGSFRRALLVPRLALFSLAEVVYFLLVNRAWRAHQVVSAWRWNLAPERRLRASRQQVASSRRLPDRVVIRLFSRRTNRLWRFLLRRGEERWSSPGWTRPSRRDLASSLAGHRRLRRRERRPRQLVVIALLVALVLLVGGRSLVFGGLPLVGQLLPLPGAGHLLSLFFGGWQDGGLQRPGPATPAFAVLGLAEGVLLGDGSLLLHLELLACVVLGAFGAARMVRPVAPPVARLAAALAYLFLPLWVNDLARGDLPGLVAFAGMPWVLARLAEAGRAGIPWRRGLGGEMAALGALLALLAAFVPATAVLGAIGACAVALGALLAGERRAGVRALAVGAGGVVLAAVLCLPWSLTFLQPGARLSSLLGAGQPSTAPGLSSLFRFALGPTGHGLLGWALLLAAALPLLVGRHERLGWAIRYWIGTLAFIAFAWVAGQGWLGGGGGALRLLSAPAAACVAACVGLGAASLVTDLRASRFGWRHLAGVAFSCCAMAGLLPVLGATPGGRYGLPVTGYDTVLAWISGKGASGGAGGAAASAAASARTLWVGDPSALPLVGWQVEPGLAIGVSSGGLPDATRLWPSPNPGLGKRLTAALTAAESGQTVRLGQLLAGDGVRYVIVPTAIAPVLGPAQQAPAAPPPELVLDALAAQSDLHQLPSEGGALAFENAAWRPGRSIPAALAGPGGVPGWLRSLGVAGELLLWVAAAVFLLARRRARPGRRAPAHARRLEDEGPAPLAPAGSVSGAPAGPLVGAAPEVGR